MSLLCLPAIESDLRSVAMDSVLYKIEEGSKSTKSHAEENPSPVDAAESELAGCKHNKELQMIQPPMEPSLKVICFNPSDDSSDEPLSGKADDLDYNAGQWNQVDLVGGGVGPLSDGYSGDDEQMIKICFTPLEDSSDDPLSRKADNLDHHLQVQNAGKENQDSDSDDAYSWFSGSDVDDDCSSDIYKYIDNEMAEEYKKYKKQVDASKGFDVDYYPQFHTTMLGGIMPVSPLLIKRENEDYKHFMEIAIAKADKVCGRQEFEDLQVVKANKECWGARDNHYITFTAKGSLDGKTRLFQALITRFYDYDAWRHRHGDIIPDDTVESVWLKDDQGQLTSCISE